MVEEYEKIYGVKGTVLYPSRASNAPEFDEPPKQHKQADEPLVFAYAGSINHLGYAKALASLATVLQTLGGKLVIYSTVNEEFIKNAGLNKSNVVFFPFIPSRELIYKLRNEVDILFLPMVFEDVEPEPTSNVKICFPSKLTDYTATGLPLLIWGPPYCSAVRWAKENPGVAEVIEQRDIQSLEKSIANLYENREYRFCLAVKALSIGKDYFSHSIVTGKFNQTINNN
jgi:glycosyltransferase involved in cell wall biosynthesis